MTSLFQKGKIYGMWRFSLSFTVSSCTTKPLSSQFWLDNAEENVAYLVLVQWWGDDRQVSQSGKPLCTCQRALPLGTPARQWRKYSCEMSTGHSYGTLTD